MSIHSLDPPLALASGGPDLATLVAMANPWHRVYAVWARYRHRHAVEVDVTMRAWRVDVRLACQYGADLSVSGASPPIDGIAAPRAGARTTSRSTPVRYVRASNTACLSLGPAWAEHLSADHVLIGVNARAHRGHPYVRPGFIEPDTSLATVAANRSVEGHPNSLYYYARRCSEHRGECHPCQLRLRGIEVTGITDPMRHQQDQE
jgi:7-cyano-7-deazaguanine synthase in queuosine biosynthesis